MTVQMQTVHNFYAGPATLPKPALERAQQELLNFAGTGMSVMELSHRSKPYMALQAEAETLVRELLGVPSDYHVLFLQGGASLQFGMIPLNLLSHGRHAHYVLTGEWASKAYKEALLFGDARILASSEDTQFDHIPAIPPVDPAACYVHITSNNTIFGTQYAAFPDTNDVPLIADMSSDIMGRPIDVSRFGLIYAGAQKNLGPSGVTLAIVRDDLVQQGASGLSTMLSYRTHVKAESMFNTPPCFAIYMLRNVLDWLKSLGGLGAVETLNHRKSARLYGVIDALPHVYRGHARKDSRSQMNVTFRLINEELEARFIKEAEAEGLIGLAGHRSVGGCRASLYNALPYDSVEALCRFMERFAARNG